MAALAPGVLAAILAVAHVGQSRDYVFLYLGIVAVLGLATGLRDALVAATSSFLLVDFFLIRPVHSLQFADPTDVLNLAVFAGAAGLIGTLGSRRRSAQFRAETLARELQQANIELARLAEAERQVRVLEETDRLRREVLANVSHELRTPISSILTGTTAMLQRGSLPHDVEPDVASLAREARRLSRLVSDLLDMTRIEGGVIDLQLTDVDVGEAITAAADRLRRQHPGREITVTSAPGLPDALADWQRLGQVLDNLLDNAQRWAPPETAIAVDAGVAAGTVVVRVVDRGPGVAHDARPHIFERFSRGDGPRPDSSSGMGLGLAIVKGLVEAQGGRVWLEDTPPDEGAVFAFSLPAPDVAADSAS